MKRAMTVIALLAGFGLIGCGTTAEQKKVEAQVQAQKPATGEGELAVRGANVFVNAPGLTTEQKEQIMKIHSETYEQAAKIREELTKTKSALFKSLVNPKATRKETSLLKGKVIALDKERLDLMLKAFDKIQKIVGKDKMDEEMLKHFTNTFESQKM